MESIALSLCNRVCFFELLQGRFACATTDNIVVFYASVTLTVLSLGIRTFQPHQWLLFTLRLVHLP